ncbi:MAG: flagellin lysine-N-methylase [Lachnospiraceae bacterium]|nr:flagellin lysine-N-methylase [Lachnospiraceae bacterium]
MLITIPDYYQDFECIADKCEDTCCAGWQIVIDKKTLKKYTKIKGDFRKRMFKSVDWFQGTFKQDKDKRCAFLNEKNLCDLYLSQGEEGFCKTCREYPRHTEEFEGVREITLSISCPEVARILMNRMEPVSFLSYEREGEEEFEDFDPFFYSILEDARKEMIAILQNRDLTITDRILLILGMAHDMQGRMNRQEMFACSDVISKYTTNRALDFVKKHQQKTENKKEEMTFAHTMFQHLFELELLREEWGVLLAETEDLLYRDKENYCKTKKEFINYFKNRTGLQNHNSKDGEPDTMIEDSNCNINITIHLEQLLVYFLFTYFPGAVYDGEIYAKVQLAVYCTWMIWEIWMARWLKNEKSIDLEEMTELVYRFSREVEHSDLNLREIEKILSKKWFLTNKTGCS